MTARRAFVLFHVVLGVGLLILSVETLVHTLGHEHEHRAFFHLTLVAGLEAIGAVLFLVPRTLKLGAILLLVTMLGALVMHAVRGEWRVDLLIYAAGVWYVMAHGAAWGRQPAA